MKKIRYVALSAAAIMLASTMATSFCGCSSPKVLHDENYNQKIDNMNIWNNSVQNAIPAVGIKERVKDFLSTPSKDGKKKKVLFIGYDGCRTDRMKDILDAKTGDPIENRESAILETLSDKRSGLYVSYTGGDKTTVTEQATSSGPGWASILTGVWKNHHKVITDQDVKNIKYKSFVLDAATGEFGKVYSSAFVASNYNNFATTFIDEINFLRENPKKNVQMPTILEHEKFFDSDGVCRVDDLQNYCRQIMQNTEIPANYNFVKPKNNESPDILIKDAALNELRKNTDVIFCIFSSTNLAGKRYGFSNEQKDLPEYISSFEYEEKLAKQVVKAAKEKAELNNEDLLIIISTDHGGYNKEYGGHSFEERTTWIACNQGFDSSYYSNNYNGFRNK